jgi:hypothetical protein
MKLTNNALTEVVHRFGGSDVKKPVHRKVKRIWKSDIAFTRNLCEVLLYGLLSHISVHDVSSCVPRTVWREPNCIKKFIPCL